jgi:hypothetical protein
MQIEPRGVRLYVFSFTPRLEATVETPKSHQRELVDG